MATRAGISQLKTTYDQRKADYAVLLQDVLGRLEKVVAESGIKIHSIKGRVKGFESFYNKVKLKNYTEPFAQCEDIAGCRIICLFRDDIAGIVECISKHFSVVSQTVKQPKADQFAYAAHHLVVRGSDKKMVCEIQVRTILQDAWSEIEHHVKYKHIGIDEKMIRKVNALSALLEIAEDEFYLIHHNYLELRDTAKITQKDKLTPILLYHYAKTTFPWAWEHQQCFDNIDNLDEYAVLVNAFVQKGVSSVHEVHQRYTSGAAEIAKDEAFHVQEIKNNPMQWPSLNERVKLTNHFYSPLLILRLLVNAIKK